MKGLAMAAHVHYQQLTEGTSFDPDTMRNLVVLIGSTRSSKLFLARFLARVLDKPFAEENADELARAGRARSAFYNLLRASAFDVEEARCGIAFIDGIDEKEVQRALHDVLERKTTGDEPDAIAVTGARLLFLCGGRFAGLDDVISRRGRHPQQAVTNHDLLAFGMLPELVSRVGAILRVDSLNEDTLERIAQHACLRHWE
jgi:ATP-dependent Clp protease ATP-binding subunit ClpX